MQTSGNIEDLTARILEKARVEAEEIVERAEKVAVRDISRVRDEMRAKAGTAEAELEDRLAAGREALRAENAILERRRIMEKREEAIEDVFAAALERLRGDSSGADRAELLKRLVQEAVDALKLERVEVRLNASDRELALKENLFDGLEGVSVSVAQEPLDSAGGVVVLDESGRIFFDNTFEARLERQREELRAKVAEIFGF
jgi:vacuolar-type H+-ATPase subunit E/Vma4